MTYPIFLVGGGGQGGHVIGAVLASPSGAKPLSAVVRSIYVEVVPLNWSDVGWSCSTWMPLGANNLDLYEPRRVIRLISSRLLRRLC